MTRRSKKVVFWSLGVMVTGLAAVTGGLWYLMQQPFYRPGMVRAAVAAWPDTLPVGRGAEASAPWTVAPGIRIHHFASGAGRNVLVIHGGPGIPFREPMAGLEPLTTRFRFHYYDQRGCGRSTRPLERPAGRSFYDRLRSVEGDLGLGAQIADIEHIRRILGDRQLLLVGHSFGAFLAALYAAELPEHVAGLVLVAPAEVLVMPAPHGELFGSVRDLIPTTLRPEYEAFLKEYLDMGRLFELSDHEVSALNARFIRFYVAAARARGFQVEEEDAASDIGGFMVQAQYISMGRRHDYRRALRAAQAPALVIHGERDLQPEEASRDYVDALPQARLVVMRGSGHVPFADQPERFAEVVGQFLDEVSGPTRAR
jgi:proline iminopeptidase